MRAVLFNSQTLSNETGILSQIHQGDHDDSLRLDLIEYAIRKIADQHPAIRILIYRPNLRIPQNESNRYVDVSKE